MRYRLVVLSVFLFGASARAVDDSQPGDDLFPLVIGNRWVYRLRGQDDRLIISAVAVEKVGAVNCFRLEGRLQNRVIATEHVALQKDGVYRYRFDGADLEPPLCICKFPTGPEETNWRAEYRLNDKKTLLAYESEHAEVHVPAGRFSAIVVHSITADGTSNLKNSVWYAPKVGMVKQVISDGAGTITLVLDRFERAGEKDLGSKYSGKKGAK